MFRDSFILSLKKSQKFLSEEYQQREPDEEDSAKHYFTKSDFNIKFGLIVLEIVIAESASSWLKTSKLWNAVTHSGASKKSGQIVFLKYFVLLMSS